MRKYRSTFRVLDVQNSIENASKTFKIFRLYEEKAFLPSKMKKLENSVAQW